MQNAVLDHPYDTHEPVEFSIGDTILTVGETGDLFAIEVTDIQRLNGLVVGRVKERRPLLELSTGNGNIEEGDTINFTAETVLGVRSREE